MEKRGSPGPQPAGDIGPLKWNDQLAEVAQRWANQCLKGHDECKSAYYVGQNIGGGYVYPGELTLEEIIKGWYDEVQLFNANHVDRFAGSQPNRIIGHYTQLVSGRTTEIGCGILKNYKSFPEVQAKKTTLICNYRPGGNILDQPVYKAHRY